MDYARTRNTLLTFLITITLTISLFAAPGIAQTDQPDWAEDLYEDARGMVDIYSGNVTDEDLGIAASQLRGERINLVITDGATGETATFSFRMDSQLRIRELSSGPRDDATLRMLTDRNTVETMNSASDPGRVFRNAVKSRAIRIQGVGVINSVKWSVINTVGGALGFFD